MIEECGKFDNWRINEVKESSLIGGATKRLYKMYKGDTIRGNFPYKPAKDEIFAPSNVMANIIGVIKTSNSVTPERRGDGYCAKMEVIVEKVKVIGMINIDVVAQGTIIIGNFHEPIRDTKSPYRKIECGMPFHDRPKGFQYDYKAIVGNEVTRATGLSPRKFIGGADYAEIKVILQKRWEDKDGNIFSERVGTGYKRITKNVCEWINGEITEIHYGDISNKGYYKKYMGLINGDTSYCTINSKGESVSIQEIGWADEDETPTHIIVWITSSNGAAFWGGIGNTLWVDNFKLVF